MLRGWQVPHAPILAKCWGRKAGQKRGSGQRLPEGHGHPPRPHNQCSKAKRSILHERQPRRHSAGRPGTQAQHRTWQGCDARRPSTLQPSKHPCTPIDTVGNGDTQGRLTRHATPTQPVLHMAGIRDCRSCHALRRCRQPCTSARLPPATVQHGGVHAGRPRGGPAQDSNGSEENRGVGVPGACHARQSSQHRRQHEAEGAQGREEEEPRRSSPTRDQETTPPQS